MSPYSYHGAAMRHGSQLNPPNPFERLHAEVDLEHLEWDNEYLKQRTARPIEYLPDASQTIVSENDSPDIGFRFSVNPYRGCVHACPYCYARNSHEYLGFNAGLDFETKIMVKHDVAKLFREFLSLKKWVPEPIIFSGVTDCYQPAEREHRLTRGCLEVALQCRQPIGMITKNALVIRDLDLFRPMAELGLIHVSISITTLDAELARVMEPRTSIPAARLRAIKILSDAGIPVRVMNAPIIPGLNDSEIPAVLTAAREAGATDARYTLLRLPLTVAPVFQEWLARERPALRDKIESLIRQTREGKLNRSGFNQRTRGTGPIAEQIRNMFRVFRNKLGFTDLPAYSTHHFHAPTANDGQMQLF